MKQFNSSLYIMTKNLVYAAGAALLVGFVLNLFVADVLAVAGGLLTGAAVAYFVVCRNNIRVTVGNGQLSVWRFGILLHQFAIDDHGFKADIVTRSDSAGSDSDCTLTVVSPEGDETAIDCSMLGPGRFYELLDELGLTSAEPARLETTRK